MTRPISRRAGAAVVGNEDRLRGLSVLVEALRLLGLDPEEARSLTVGEVARALEGMARTPVVEDDRGSGACPRPQEIRVTSDVRAQSYTRDRKGRARPAPLLLRTRDAASLLAVSERVVWQLIRTGQLRPIHPAGLRATRIAVEDVEDLARRWRAASQDGTAELTRSKRGPYGEETEPV
jgi:hypothetical protein